ncbi:MAG: hypothetical protein H7222_15060 [Methylotenera sp.]|nr:hypothetical protein [Oligoflexia bacterium]
MKLYLVHCGYYDPEISQGIYEFHVNFMVAAENFEMARANVKEKPEFKTKRMHVDGAQELEAVDGYRIELNSDASLAGESRVTPLHHRDLAPKKPIPSTS